MELYFRRRRRHDARGRVALRGLRRFVRNERGREILGDFLLRVENPDAQLGWSYEVADTKLARSVKAGALLQICVYNEMLSQIQGVYPERMYVALGGKEAKGTVLSIGIIDFGMNLQQAGDAARVRHGGSSQPTGEVMTDGGTVFLERGFSEDTRRALEELGHKLGDSDGSFGGYQAIMFDKNEGVYYGASEVRKDGQAAGY